MKKYWEEIKYHMEHFHIQLLIEYKPGLYQGLYVAENNAEPKN